MHKAIVRTFGIPAYKPSILLYPHVLHHKLQHLTHITTGERITLQDIMNFPVKLWLVFIICVCYYVTVFPFIGLAA